MIRWRSRGLDGASSPISLGSENLGREERGDMLPFALVAVMIGVLLIGPLLVHVSSSHFTTRASGVMMERQYTSDAGAEYGIYRLQTDSALRQALIDTPFVPLPLDWPADEGSSITVNQQVPVVEVVCLGTLVPCTEKLNWVLWAGSDSGNQTIQTTGQGHTIIGNMHSNHNIVISGSGHAINGTITYVGDYTGPEEFDRDKVNTIVALPFAWSIADFDLERDGKYAQAADAEGKYYRHVGNWNCCGPNSVIPPGLYYVTGKATVSGRGEGVTIVSEDSISVSGSDIYFTPYVDDPVPLVFLVDNSNSSKGVDISGSGRIEGVAYAPRGLLSLTGSGGTIYGAFLGAFVKVAGEGARIELTDIDIIVDCPPGVDMDAPRWYDVRSTVDGMVTTARLWHGIDGSWRILSWFVE